MFLVWFFVFLGVLAYCIYNAGVNTKSLFYTERYYSYDNITKVKLDGDKVMMYIIKSVLASLFWYITIPAYGIFILGKKNRKDS